MLVAEWVGCESQCPLLPLWMLLVVVGWVAMPSVTSVSGNYDEEDEDDGRRR